MKSIFLPFLHENVSKPNLCGVADLLFLIVLVSLGQVLDIELVQIPNVIESDYNAKLQTLRNY